jgi:hypothetical protein
MALLTSAPLSRSPDEYLCDYERVADLESIFRYQERIIKRLSSELKTLQALGDEQLSILDSVNEIFAETSGARYCADRRSLIARALKSSGELPDEAGPGKAVLTDGCYSQPTTEEILLSVRKATDFRVFFYEFPLGFVAFFDPSPIEFNATTVLLEVETWDPERRRDFFDAYAEHINSIGFIFKAIMSLIDCDSVPMLSDVIDHSLNRHFNCPRVAFYVYDREASELVMEKHKLRVRRKLDGGFVFEALKANELRLTGKDSEGLSECDAALLKNNQQMLIAPVACDGVCSAVVLFFDKYGGFCRIDLLMAQALRIFIGHLLPMIDRIHLRLTSIGRFQDTLDTFLDVVNAADSSDFRAVVSKTMTSRFQCRFVKIFRFSKKSQTFCALEELGRESEEFSVNTGIVGTCMKRGVPMKLAYPESSILFHAGTDRPEPAVVCSSILVCPVLTPEKEAKFAIALYNKQELSAFTDVDVWTLRMITENLCNILQTVWRTQKVRSGFAHQQTQIQLFTSILKVIPGLSMTNGSDTLLQHISKALEEYQNDMRFTLSYLSDAHRSDFVQSVAFGDSIQEFLTEDHKRSILCGLRTTELNQIGLIEATARKAIATAQHRSVSDGASVSKPVRDFKLTGLLANWQLIGGPILEAAKAYSELFAVGKWFLALLDKYPSDSAVAFRLFCDLQAVFPANPASDQSLFLLLPLDNPEFQTKFVELWQSFGRFIESPLVPDGEPLRPIVPVAFPPADVYGFKFDVLSLSSGQIVDVIDQIAAEFGIAKFLGCDEQSFRALICALESLHLSDGFECWSLCVDRFQLLATVLTMIPASARLTPERACPLLLHQLVLFSRSLTSTGKSSEGMTRFHLENGRGLSGMAPLYIATSIAPNFPMSAIDGLAKTFLEMEEIRGFEALYAEDVVFQLGELARFSYFARDESIARKWSEKRFLAEGESIKEIQNYILDFDMRSLVLPLFMEVAKKGLRLDSVRRRMMAAFTAISGIAF